MVGSISTPKLTSALDMAVDMHSSVVTKIMSD